MQDMEKIQEDSQIWGLSYCSDSEPGKWNVFSKNIWENGLGYIKVEMLI